MSTTPSCNRYLQGEYADARQRYQQSLAIAEELGDRAGVAATLAQMGVLFEREEQLDRAVVSLAQALALFEQLGMPQRDQVRRILVNLRDRMGEEALNAALVAANASQASEGDDEQG